MRIGLAAIALLGLPSAFAESQIQPTAPAAAHGCNHHQAGEQPIDVLHHQQPKHKRAQDLPVPTTVSSVSISSSSSAAKAGAVTEIAIFSADGITYTVTSVDGVEKVDGKTLSAGAGPIDIGGIEVAEATGKKPGIVAGGKTIRFKTDTMASSSAAPMSSIVPSSSSSSPSSSSSSPNAAAATPGVGRGGKVVGLACGAVVAGLVL